MPHSGTTPDARNSARGPAGPRERTTSGCALDTRSPGAPSRIRPRTSPTGAAPTVPPPRKGGPNRPGDSPRPTIPARLPKQGFPTSAPSDTVPLFRRLQSFRSLGAVPQTTGDRGDDDRCRDWRPGLSGRADRPHCPDRRLPQSLHRPPDRGGRAGADTLCRQWATARGIPVETIPADWTEHGWAAGPVRNRAILDRKPGLLVVFTGSPEAEDFARLAAERHLLVFRWPRNPPPPAPSTDGTTVTG
ncbi:SLOG family protein [Planctomyces sp. SH-PL14]|uniref:SLOG family protein n=1 Tax=Planctomyces sp. SH-PL14 TaxID=1632864 RepID=UPI0009EE5734